MKKSLLLAAVFIVGYSTVKADKDFKNLGEYTLTSAISANGQYVVGVNFKNNLDGISTESFLYDTTTDKLNWITKFDEENLETSGEFKDVTDNGIICGTAKDLNTIIYYEDAFGKAEGPANTAAVWKDGKCTRLYYGDFNTSAFEYLGDGSRSVGISSDGKKVCGYISTGNSAQYYPCIWTELEDGIWKHEWLNVPNDFKYAIPRFISEDGNLIVGKAVDKLNNAYISLWKDGTCQIITNNDIGNEIAGSFGDMDVLNISSNGKYIIIKGSSQYAYIYDVENSVSHLIPNYAFKGVISNAAIDNNGNVTAAYNYGSAFMGDAYTRSFWYSYEDNRILDLTYYMDIFASGIMPDIEFDYNKKSQAFPIAMSADGNIIAGNADIQIMAGQTPKSWILKSEKFDVSIPPTPIGLSAISENAGQVTLSWIKDDTKYEDITLIKYIIYRDGNKTAEIPEDKPTVLIQDGVGGHPIYTIEGVYNLADGKTIVSPMSEPLTASVPDTYAIPLLEDFESTYFDTNYWERVKDYGPDMDAMWDLIVDYGLIKSSLWSTVISQEPYSGSIVSRPLDATKLNKINVSFLFQYSLLKEDNQTLDKDSISVEITTDNGKSWKEVKAWSLKDISSTGYAFNTLSADLSSFVAGKIFKMRLRKFGLGLAQYMAYADNIKISSDADAAAPTGLIGLLNKEDQSLNLTWKSPSSAYLLNHINVPSMTRRWAIGNEGNEFIVANAFDNKDLQIFDGKYLSGISSIINYNSYVETILGINASVIIFEDNKIVREQKIENLPYNEVFTVALDEPLKINASKELKIGLKFFDYDAPQMPACCVLTETFLPGKSDLYSDDNGKTWKKISDFYAEQGQAENGFCCWDITGCITDTPEFTPSEDEGKVFNYNVYRDGEQLNNLIIDRLQARFVDPQPIKGANYYVEAYYIDGRNSDTSLPFYYDGTSNINESIADGIEISYIQENKIIAIEGDFDNLSLINSSGVCVAYTDSGNLSLASYPKGLYIIRIEAGNNVYVKKILVK